MNFERDTAILVSCILFLNNMVDSTEHIEKNDRCRL